jgi:hypothetical protein
MLAASEYSMDREILLVVLIPFVPIKERPK